MAGKLTCVVGPMFSGKTTWLIEALRGAESEASCLVVTHASDNRYTSDLEICTHDRRKAAAQKVACLADVSPALLERHAAVFVDEGHFFPDLVEFSDRWATAGKRVYVAMLKGTFRREPFSNAARMFSVAEQLIDLPMDCNGCGQKNAASFTMRSSSEQAELLVGGAEIYSAVCRSCYFASNPAL